MDEDSLPLSHFLSASVKNKTVSDAFKNILQLLDENNDIINEPSFGELIQNEIEFLTDKLVNDVRDKIELYKRKCLPLLRQDYNTPVPVLIRNRRDELVEFMEEEPWSLTATEFAEEIEETVYTLLNDDPNDDAEEDNSNEEYRGLDSKQIGRAHV